MPIYEQDPKELLGEDIQQIAAPDDSNFYMETPSLRKRQRSTVLTLIYW